MFRLAVLVVGPKVAEILAVVVAVTVVVVMENVAVVFPDGMVTDAGVVAELLPLEMEMTSPPVGAAVPMVTVPVAVLPPLTEAGLTVRVLSTGGVMVRVAD